MLPNGRGLRIITNPGRVAEQADASDLKSEAPQGACGFESHLDQLPTGFTRGDYVPGDSGKGGISVDCAGGGAPFPGGGAISGGSGWGAYWLYGATAVQESGWQ